MKKLGAILIAVFLLSGIATAQIDSTVGGNNFDSWDMGFIENRIDNFDGESEITVSHIALYSEQPDNITYDFYKVEGSTYTTLRQGTYEHGGNGYEYADIADMTLTNPPDSSSIDEYRFGVVWENDVVYWGGSYGTFNGIAWAEASGEGSYGGFSSPPNMGIRYTVPNTPPAFNDYDTTGEWWINEPINVSYNVTDPDGTVEEVTVEITDSNGNVEKSETFTYSSSNVVDSHDSFFTPTEADNYTVSYTATDNDQEDSVTLNLNREVKGYEFDKQLDVEVKIRNMSKISRGDVIDGAGDIEFTMDEEINRKNFSQITVLWDNEIQDISTDFSFKAGTIDISNMNNGETIKRQYDYDTTDISNSLWSDVEENNSRVGVSMNLLLEETDGSGDVVNTGATYISRNDGVFQYFESFGDSGVLYETGQVIWEALIAPVLEPILELVGWIWSGIVYALLFVLDLLVIIVGMALQVLLWAVGSLFVALANSLQMFMFYHVDVDYEWRENNTTVETYDTFENLSEEKNVNFIQAIGGNLSVKSGRTQVDVWDDRFGVDNYPILEYKNEAVVWRYNYSVLDATRQNVTEDNVKSGDR